MAGCHPHFSALRTGQAEGELASRSTARRPAEALVSTAVKTAGVALAFLVWFLIPIAVAQWGGRDRGLRHPWAWGAVLGWIGVLVVFLHKPRAGSPASIEEEQAAAEREYEGADPTIRDVKCPSCGVRVSHLASVCGSCGATIS